MHLKRETTFSTASVKRYLQVTDKQFSEAAGVARMQLSQVVALLIERWDYMTPEEQGAITNLLTRSNARIS